MDRHMDGYIDDRQLRIYIQLDTVDEQIDG